METPADDALTFRPRACAPGGRVYGLAMAALWAGVELPDPNAGSPARRQDVQRLVAAAGAVYGGAELREQLRQARVASGRAPGWWGRRGLDLAGLAGGAATAGLSLAAAPLNRRVDAWAVRALARLGVPRPRWALAGASALLMLAANASTRAGARQAAVVAALTGPEAEGTLELMEVPADARAVIAALLDPSRPGARHLPGGAELRGQLPHLRAVEDRPGVTFTDWLALVVDEDAPVERAVPHDFTWPVRARFVHEGERFELTLRVVDGELGALALEPLDPARDEAWEARGTIDRWPTTAELTWTVDAP
ncbi:hypothetical protein [Micrococcus sp.]|uniref:hypothetical protein n=1 Tax=Micrococcus sp. TaxID=1271 RepID=UPI002A909D72|nr:hypothetical protein [Micrococcus sp.]MDY6056078.1 hypothetical protein [Micrococcus sp.]